MQRRRYGPYRHGIFLSQEDMSYLQANFEGWGSGDISPWLKDKYFRVKKDGTLDRRACTTWYTKEQVR